VRRQRLCALALIVCLVAGALASIARAGGDPGSHKLASQGLFVAGTAAGAAGSGQNADLIASIAVGALLVVAVAGRLAVLWRRRRGRLGRPIPGRPIPGRPAPAALTGPSSDPRRRSRARGAGWVRPGFGMLFVLAIGTPILAFGVLNEPSRSQSAGLAGNPYLDPGTPLSGPAPDFTLTDQFGRSASLHSFRGRVVILDFNDSQCTTICPLTTSAMVAAKAMLGAAGSRVQLLGVNANPQATSVHDVLSYSQLHGMLHRWRFETGSRSALKRVWSAYGISDKIQRGQIDHTPALFVIDPEGRLRKLYLTQQSYAAVGQLGQILAQEVANLLPGRPAVDSTLSYAQIPGIGPSTSIALPRAGGGTARLGSGDAPHLTLFFATWDRQVTRLAAQLDALNRYAASAAPLKLPRLTAVDEGTVEPGPGALPRFLGALPRPLAYPVAIDPSGRVADGYEVQDEPWLVLTSAAGRILWYWPVATSGWLSSPSLAAHVRAALARTPTMPTNAAAINHELAGSPPPLAALHSQASQVLGSQPALAARLASLRGYPIVINAWASWCSPCRAEFGLLAGAAARYGRRVAFLGADTSDSGGDARSFLARHPVSYPSYQTTLPQLGSILSGGLEGLPTTIFINRAGKVTHVHTGQYDSAGTLAGDIASYAIKGAGRP